MKVTAHCCVGGKSVDEDLKKFNHGTQIISGTPGRVYDMIQRKSFKTKNVKMLVIDEADEMLSRGFKEQVYDIYRYLPVSTQNVVVSATLPDDVLEMTSQFMAEDTVKILVKRSKISLDGIKQFYIDVQKEEYKLIVKKLYNSNYREKKAILQSKDNAVKIDADFVNNLFQENKDIFPPKNFPHLNSY